jgi:hypothetical protein
VAKFHAVGVAAVFAADAELDVGTALPSFVDDDLYELADRRPIGRYPLESSFWGRVK